MQIDVCRASDGIFYDFSGEYTIESGELLDRELVFKTPIKVQGQYVTDKGDVYVTSRAECDIEFKCDRCLKPVVETLVFEVDETYVRADSVKAESEDVFTYESNMIYLDEAIEQSLYLAIPIQVLCKEDCKGLCPVCGCNLNDETCNCMVDEGESVAEDTNNPFAVLKNINFNTGGASNGSTKG